MDEIKDYEIELLMSNMHYSYKNEWEMTRMIMYSEMLPYMKKGSDKKPHEDYEEHEYNITDAQIEHLKNLSKRIGSELFK